MWIHALTMAVSTYQNDPKFPAKVHHSHQLLQVEALSQSQPIATFLKNRDLKYLWGFITMYLSMYTISIGKNVLLTKTKWPFTCWDLWVVETSRTLDRPAKISSHESMKLTGRLDWRVGFWAESVSRHSNRTDPSLRRRSFWISNRRQCYGIWSTRESSRFGGGKRSEIKRWTIETGRQKNRSRTLLKKSWEIIKFLKDR